MCETYLLISADTCVDAFILVRTAECSQEIIVILLEWEHLIFLHRDYNWDNWRETLIYFFLSNKKPRGSSKTTDRKRALGPWNPWILQSTLGISDPRFRKSLDSSNSRIFKYSICIFFLFPFEQSSLKIRGFLGSSDTRSSSLGDSLDPCGSSDPTTVPGKSGRWIKWAWPIGPDVDQNKGPSNSLRFREAAARFGSLISFRI